MCQWLPVGMNGIFFWLLFLFTAIHAAAQVPDEAVKDLAGRKLYLRPCDSKLPVCNVIYNDANWKFADATT